MMEDLGGVGARLIYIWGVWQRQTSIVCDLINEDLWGVRILEEWGSWRSEDLGGVKILEEWGSWRSEDIGGVKILEEWGSWRSRDEIHRYEEFEKDWHCLLLEDRGSWRSVDEVDWYEKFDKDKISLFVTWLLKILEDQGRDWRTRGVKSSIVCCLMIEDIGWLRILEKPGRDWMIEESKKDTLESFALLWLRIVQNWGYWKS